MLRLEKQLRESEVSLVLSLRTLHTLEAEA